MFRDPDWIQTNDLLLSLPATAFAARTIWGLDYNFTIAGVPRLVSTEPFENRARSARPQIDCFELYLPSKSGNV